ncbi:MAG: dienelactone hydrolase, partial [Alphaproteobacteria bacterium]|nr:dienelactone hydrolase [Alphaproteobacteria bacterium]
MRAAAAIALLLAALVPATAAANWSWPDADTLQGVSGEAVSYPSSSPFTLSDVHGDAGRNPPTPPVATWYAPRGASPARRAPAVVLLHGSA